MLFYRGRARIVDANGDAVSNAKLYFYLTGTTTPADVYTDADLTVAHTQPVRSSASGFVAPIYLDPSVTYKCVITDASDVALPDGTVDPLLNSTFSAAVLGATLFPVTDAEAAYPVTPTTLSFPSNESVAGGNVNRFASLSATIPYDTRFVPAGTYALGTSVLDGLFGDGDVTGGGARVYIPKAPTELNPVKSLVEKLARIRGNYQNITLIGDSISDYYYVTAETKHWFTMLRNNIGYLNSNSDFEITTNFDDPYIKTYTIGGSTSFGTKGPLGRSLILAVGGYIEFTGAYDNVDCFFVRAVGAGSLAFSYNGGAAYKTVSCAGAALDDYHTTQVAGFVATSTASGTHRITCTGAAVEITGLTRLLRVYGSVSEQIRFTRIARAGYSTTQFATNAALTSIKSVGCSSEPATNTTKQALFIVALGTNNMYNVTNQTTTTAYLTDLMKIFAALSEAGSIVFLTPFKPGRATLTGSEYESYIAAAKIACDAFNVPMIDLQPFAFNTAGMTTDNLHPDDDGNERMFEIITDAISKLPLPGPAQVAGTKDLGNYVHTFNSGGLSTGTVGFGTAHGAYFDGTNYVATHTTATIFQENGTNHKIYHDAGLTPGSTFTPTLVCTINSSQQTTWAQNMLVNGQLFIGTSKTLGFITTPGTYANDAAAAAGGVAVGDVYRNGSVLMVRVA